MTKDYINPDLLDALASSDVASHISDRFLSSLDGFVQRGIDIDEIENLLITVLEKEAAESSRRENLERQVAAPADTGPEPPTH